MGKLNGKIAVVTGVSRRHGIGAAICKELAQNGCDIFFTYWTAYDKQMPWGVLPDEPAVIYEQLTQFGGRVAAMEVDLTNPDAPVLLLDKVEEQLGHPDILINNAAYSTDNSFSTLTADELDKHYWVNIRAAALLSSRFARHFTKKTGGRIVNLTSGQFRGPMPGELAYTATKGAVDAMTITLAAELAPLGITVNAVNPGPTDTGWVSEDLRQELQPRFPFGRLGEPGDAAKTVNFLVSEEAGWITGQIIHSEGGSQR